MGSDHVEPISWLVLLSNRKCDNGGLVPSEVIPFKTVDVVSVV